jgi:hypothetical protein
MTNNAVPADKASKMGYLNARHIEVHNRFKGL